jgi:membrane AbrB-like protein
MSVLARERRSSKAWRRPAPVLGLLRVVVVTGALAALFTWLGLPSAALFAGLLGGMLHALRTDSALPVPPGVYRLAHAMVGVVIGSAVTLEALREIAQQAVPIGVVVLVTIVVSVLAGCMLAIRKDVTPVTGVFALIAGGASGVVAVAQDLGADARVVTVVQYLRVLIVLLTIPVVLSVAFSGASFSRSAGVTAARDGWADLAFTLTSLILGLVMARLLPFSTATLLFPLAVSVVLVVGGWLGAVHVPAALQDIAFALIGAQVGLRFTRQSMLSIARMLPAVLALTVAVMAITAASGVVLARLTSVDGLTAYLATTPGGLFAVLSTAADAGADVTFVLALQLCRLLVILAVAPLIARCLRVGYRGGPPAGHEPALSKKENR